MVTRNFAWADARVAWLRSVHRECHSHRSCKAAQSVDEQAARIEICAAFFNELLTSRPITNIMACVNALMNGLLSNLLAGLLFIHAVLGCCWHHAHARSAGPAPLSAVGGLPLKCCHGHRHGDSKPERSNGNCPCEMECSGTCQFVSTKKVEVEPPSWRPNPFLADSVPLAGAQFAFLADGGERLKERIAPREVLRLHLLHQILLI